MAHGCEFLVEIVEHILEVADDREINFNVLIDLCGIDINVNDLSILCEFLGISNNTVGKARTHSDQKIAFADAEV